LAWKGAVFQVGARKKKRGGNMEAVEEEVGGWEKGRNVSGWREAGKEVEGKAERRPYKGLFMRHLQGSGQRESSHHLYLNGEGGSRFQLTLVTISKLHIVTYENITVFINSLI
jgi:hypothetical protein